MALRSSPILERLKNRINLRQIPFSERGSRLLVFHEYNHFNIRLAERWIKTSGKLAAKLFVQGAALEAIGRPARPEVLEELARVSRGKVFDAKHVDQILQAISDIPSPPEKIRRIQLWSHPLVAGALITLLGVFWIARKSAGLF